MNFPNFRAFVDNKMYKVIGWSPEFVFLSRKYESRYIQSINVRKNDVILMQGSNLKDIKGNEIYCGDIVKNADNDVGIVRFRDGSFEVDFKEYIVNFLGLISEELEIVGNIHCNSKLLNRIVENNKKAICLNSVEKRLRKKRKRTSR